MLWGTPWAGCPRSFDTRSPGRRLHLDLRDHHDLAHDGGAAEAIYIVVMHAGLVGGLHDHVSSPVGFFYVDHLLAEPPPDLGLLGFGVGGPGQQTALE